MCTTKTGSMHVRSESEGLLASNGLLVAFSIIALGLCFGVLPPERYGILIPKKMRKNDAVNIAPKMIFLFINKFPH